MVIVECDVPATSLLDRKVVEAADFRDAYRAPLTRLELGMVEIFSALFGHAPLYVKLALVVRNAVAKLAGLDVPTVAEIMKVDIRGAYRIGDKIGPWSVFSINEREIVAGRDNKHLDFRVSVLKQAEDDATSVTVSTICIVHNVWGKIYLFFIVPFHRLGVKDLISRAVAAKRL